MRSPSAPFAPTLALVAAVLAACSGTAASPTATLDPAATARPSVLLPTSVPGSGLPPVADLPWLQSFGDAVDGMTLLVKGSYYQSGVQQLLCDAMLQSYPPMPGGNRLLLTGTLPTSITQQLASTRGDPSMAQATWGEVEVIGVYHAANGSTAASMEMQSVRVDAGGGVDGGPKGGGVAPPPIAIPVPAPVPPTPVSGG
jgi:hypothetical protein